MLPALVVCPDSRLAAWRYHLAMHGKFDTVLLDQGKSFFILMLMMHKLGCFRTCWYNR